MFRLEFRKRTLVNTDPQRRCYNGCHAKSEWQWTAWSWLEWDVHPDRVEKRLTFWRELNDYAVRERGKGALQQFRIRRVPNV